MAKESRLTRVPDGVPDDENPEWTAEEIRTARPAAEVLPAAFMANVRRHRGKQKTPTKQLVSLRLDASVLAAYRSTGRGWQSRMNATLAENAPKTGAAAGSRRRRSRRSKKAVVRRRS